MCPATLHSGDCRIGAHRRPYASWRPRRGVKAAPRRHGSGRPAVREREIRSGISRLCRNPSLRLYVKGRIRSLRMYRPGIVLLIAVALSVSAFAGDKKKDVNEIGNRDVGKGVNFYSLEKEIALGKQLAEEVERQARMFNDPL